MRYAIRLVSGMLLGVLPVVWMPLALAQPVVALSDANPAIDLKAEGLEWIDESGQAGIARLAGNGPGRQRPAMKPAQDQTVHALGSRAALWQHYRFSKEPDASQEWVLEFPLPLLDRVTVFQQTKSGDWVSQTAGDTVAVANWPEPGRYAQFHLDLPDDGVHDVYVRIQHVTAANIPVNVISGQVRSHRLQVEYMIIGVVFGALLLLIVAGAVQAWAYRDQAFAWYAVYAGIMTLIVASTSGVAGHFLWGDFPHWNNFAQGFLGFLGGSSALLLIRKLCGPVSHHRWLDHLVLGTGMAGPALAFAYLGLDRQWGVRLVGSYLVVVIILGLISALLASRRRDVVGIWVLGGFTPLALATLLVVARILGWVPTSWLSQYAFMLSLAFEVPLLLVALNVRSRERHGVEAREQAMASHDALTGLLAPHLFKDRLAQMISRRARHQEQAAVVYVELVNYPYIKRSYGVAVAEQSLLRSVIKLRRILRDVDTVGRVDEARFGLILEGVSSREPVTQLAARLIAAGLMPLKGLKPEVILQFHVAGVLLKERLMDGPDISRALGELLSGMAPRSRRPIRFLEPELTRPMPLEADSGLDDNDGDSLPAPLPTAP
ncbi:MAG: 7TM diverse intracellular signaling domain-containing protein [Polaromonas sp.]|nr:7TM diverse intracellular signaling domain-containing protein [Polaromonas sp.]